MTVTSTPTISATITVRVCKQEAAVGQRESGLLEEPEKALGEAEAEHDPDDRGEEADDERLDQHGPHDLAP